MFISQETIDALSNQGIYVRWYPEKSFEEFAKRIWKEQYDYSFDYGKNHVRCSKAADEGHANVLYNSMEEFEGICRKFADSTYKRNTEPYDFTTLIVEHDNGKVLVKKENVKSKRITEDYILKLVDKNRKAYAGAYGDFALQMQKLCSEQELKYSIYPTTYGIGVLLLFNFSADKDIARVEQIMKERNIEYYNEFSEMHWVYRFKISKKKENLQRILI